MVVVTPAAAEARPRPATFRFTGGTAPGIINVTCAPGAQTGKSPTRLKVKATRRFNKKVTENFIGNSLGLSTKFVATYPGGSLTLGRFERWYTINAQRQFSFPCPMTAVNGTSQFEITIQPYRGRRPIGTAARVNVTLRRVGSSS
jgi:hypothetical protein